jgi:uncharacterized damage-inducible protein DinB
MSEIERIGDLLQFSYNGSPWHGPSLVQNLDGITAQMAVEKPIPNGHCIWEIIQHITAWMNEVIKVLDGEQYTVLTPEQDWPAIAADDAAWDAALGIMDSSQEALLGAVAEIEEDTLWENVDGQEFSYYWLLHGLVQHYVYHTGQIGLLRKALLA